MQRHTRFATILTTLLLAAALAGLAVGISPAVADDGEKGVLRTYTSSDGSVTIRTVEDPNVLERLSHWLDTALPTLRWPLAIGLAANGRREAV